MALLFADLAIAIRAPVRCRLVLRDPASEGVRREPERTLTCPPFPVQGLWESRVKGQ